jgi:small subunit ribosomal protein S3
VIGRGGQRVDELRTTLERLAGRRMRVNIVEIRMPEVDAALVARSVADQLERRVSHRRAMKQAVARAVQRGALGLKIKVSGRLGGGEMSRKDKEMVGRVPLHTLRADIDYGTAEARTTLGRIGVKVWVYKGDIRFEHEERERVEEEESEPGPAPAAAPAAE